MKQTTAGLGETVTYLLPALWRVVWSFKWSFQSRMEHFWEIQLGAKLSSVVWTAAANSCIWRVFILPGCGGTESTHTDRHYHSPQLCKLTSIKLGLRVKEIFWKANCWLSNKNMSLKHLFFLIAQLISVHYIGVPVPQYQLLAIWVTEYLQYPKQIKEALWPIGSD